MSEKKEETINKIVPTFSYKLIYVFRINNSHDHDGCLKIGDATIRTNKNYDELTPNCSELNEAARNRIDKYTSTAGITYELLHTEVAVYRDEKEKSKTFGKLLAFRDYQVHEVLKRSGIEPRSFDTLHKQNEWFECDLETAKNAIKAVKENHTSLTGEEISYGRNPIIFRPEQEDAIKQAIRYFKHGNQFLWFAKMRFGKTICGLEVVKREAFRKTLIVTHKPVVDVQWYEDFSKIFYNMPEYRYGSKEKGEELSKLLANDSPFVFFKSMQDLRGSRLVGGKYDKNQDVFDVHWDFVIIDEAHEGTRTELGEDVCNALIKPDTKVLELSGTPFNLFDRFKADNIYTWDYVMEQQSKLDWAITHCLDPNPYEDLPTMNFCTYHLEKMFTSYLDIMDKAFRFNEFFRVWTGDIKKDGSHIPVDSEVGRFVHEKDVKAFLDLLCKKSAKSNYPFSTDTFRDYFRHTLWVVPGVKEAKALSKLLKSHPVFGFYSIVNVAGNGDEEIASKDALKAVREAITDHPEKTRTITLSCGRLTTGVTVPEWTAVFMLAGSYSTSAAQYMQTIFRVQSPANIDGKVKENCYVFDFAPDRSLKMIVDSVFASQRSIDKNITKEKCMERFLNYCPVISIDGSSMKEYNVPELLQQLKKASIERVQKNGFDDANIYNSLLLKLDGVDLENFKELKGILGATKQTKKVREIEINNEGFTDEETERIEKIENTPGNQLTEEQKKEKEEFEKRRKERESAISILRGISIRIPLLIYGMDKDVDSSFSIDDLADVIDDSSWEEFMPKGVSKDLFKKFTKYYDKEVFIGAAMRVRDISKRADELEPEERIEEITKLFATFKNPDKETVLTPWRVVNMHLSQTIGGYCFYDEKFEEPPLNTPRYVDQKEVTKEIFDKDSNVLEINSKTGLYPLYLTYTFYRKLLEQHPRKDELSLEEKQALWDEVIKKNIFAICKTDMAKLITKRTLLGYRPGEIHAHAFDDLVMQMKDKQTQLIQKIKNPSFWEIKEEGEMKFNAIVGNPPYQFSTGGGQSQGTPVYDKFVLFSISLKPEFLSLIIPSRWFAGGFPSLDLLRKKIVEENKLKLIVNYFDARDLFPTVDIKGGICFFLYEKDHKGLTKFINIKRNGDVSIAERQLQENRMDSIIRDNEAVSIINKILNSNFASFASIVSPLWVNSTKSTYETLHKQKEREDDIFAYVLKNSGYIDNDELKKGREYVDKWKLFVPRSIGSADVTKDRIKTILGEPNTCCSGTYLIIGTFKNKEEALNCQSYINTKFFHFLLSLKKVSQDTVKKCYELIPMQNFDRKYNDKYLFDKYKLNEKEQEYIEKTVWS